MLPTRTKCHLGKPWAERSLFAAHISLSVPSSPTMQAGSLLVSATHRRRALHPAVVMWRARRNSLPPRFHPSVCKLEDMKHKQNQQRKAGTAFNSIDRASGYSIRLERAGSLWWALPSQLLALGVGTTVAKAKGSAAQGIQLWLKGAREESRPIPDPEHLPAANQRIITV